MEYKQNSVANLRQLLAEKKKQGKLGEVAKIEKHLATRKADPVSQVQKDQKRIKVMQGETKKTPGEFSNLKQTLELEEERKKKKEEKDLKKKKYKEAYNKL